METSSSWKLAVVILSCAEWWTAWQTTSSNSHGYTTVEKYRNTARRYAVQSEMSHPDINHTISSTLHITYGDRDLDAVDFDCEVRNITIDTDTTSITSRVARDNSNEANIICMSKAQIKFIPCKNMCMYV